MLRVSSLHGPLKGGHVIVPGVEKAACSEHTDSDKLAFRRKSKGQERYLLVDLTPGRDWREAASKILEARGAGC